MQTRIIMRETRQELKPGCTTAYQTTASKTRRIGWDTYDNITSEGTQRWFRRLGGSETATKGYTCLGYKVIGLVSKSPDKDQRVSRTFTFHAPKRG